MAEQLCPSSSAYSLAAGDPASAITLYAVLAGHGADGGLMGHFLGMCNVVYLLGAVRKALLQIVGGDKLIIPFC